MLLRRVIPHFTGKDARDLDNLVDEVYVVDSNYKMGQALKEIPVHLSGSGTDTPPRKKSKFVSAVWKPPEPRQ